MFKSSACLFLNFCKKKNVCEYRRCKMQYKQADVFKKIQLEYSKLLFFMNRKFLFLEISKCR